MSTATTRTSEGDLGLDSLGQQARALLAGGRFRKARDELKELCKRDRARFLPLLIDANVGLAREMIETGFAGNARTVIDYLKTIAPKEVIEELELRLALKTGGAMADASPLPASKSELFFTNFDQQESIRVEALQGESTYPAENIKIGEFEVSGLARVPAGNAVAIHFELDLNGMLKVTAKEKKTGLAKTVTMDTRGRPELNLDQARQNIAALRSANVMPPGRSGTRIVHGC